MEDRSADAVKAFLDRFSGRHVTLEMGESVGKAAHHDGGKQRLLGGKADIDGWLAGAGTKGDLVHAGAAQAALEE
jgi:hypothetical protein